MHGTVTAAASLLRGAEHRPGRHRAPRSGRHRLDAGAAARRPVVASLVVAYLTANIVLPRLHLQTALSWYVIGPALWIGVAWTGRAVWRDTRRSAVGATAGVIQVVAFLVAGIAAGMGRSPAVGPPLAMLGTAWFVGTALLGVETARAALFRRWRERGPALAFSTVALGLAVVDIPAAGLHPAGTAGAAGLIAGLAVPAVVTSTVATRLVEIGGPGPALAYRSLAAAFLWWSPLLPDLSLMGRGVVAVGAGLACLAAVEATESGVRALRPRPVIAAAVAAAVVVVSASGIAGVRPLVVGGDSMVPTFHLGDVLVLVPTDGASVGIGQIVSYRRGSLDVVHRVVDVERTGSSLSITTRGDHNTADDPPIDASAVQNRVLFSIPRLGLPGLVLRRLVSTDG